jgi:hypothetical protein
MNQPECSVDQWSVVSVQVKNGGGFVSTHSNAFMSGTGTTLNLSHGQVNCAVSEGIAWL